MIKPLIVIVLFLLFISNANAGEDRFESIIALNQKDPTLALARLKKIYAKAIDDNDELLEGKCLQQMGKICNTQGHFSQSLEFFLKADKIFGNTNQPILMAANLNDAGVLYYYMKQKDKAMHSYRKAIGLYKRLNNLTGQVTVLGNIGQLYEKRQLYDSAFYYQKLALKINEKLNNKSETAKIMLTIIIVFKIVET